MAKLPKPQELTKIDFKPPETSWMDTPVDFRPGTYSYASKPESLEMIGFPNPRIWSPADEDWKLPENWQTIILDGLRDRLQRFRSLKVYMDICVRCGACADKCHFFLGSGDPKNMPVLRAELLRSVYRKEYTLAGKLMAKMVGARELTLPVLKEWFYYFFQCTECRRCSVYCPYGIDTAEITMIGRELLNLVGLSIDWVMGPVSACYMKGNHLGIQPHGVVDSFDMALDDIEDITGVRLDLSYNRKGAEILYVPPSGDVFATPGTYSLMGQLMLFHEMGLDYTLSTYNSEGGNFGLFTSNEMMKRLNAKIYAEAQRLGVKYIIGGECGHMWRVLNQYMDTMNGPAPSNMEVPKNPVTGTVFENARSTKMIHVTEFTADLLRHNKVKLDPSRNSNIIATYHDSCNPARAMGLFDEPRYILDHCVEWHEMPEDTIREKTFCCGSGAGLGNDENMEMRMRGGFPRANAVKFVKERHGVNMLACICAIDRAALPPLMNYWNPGVEVCGVHELLGNALVMKGEKKRTENLRFEPLPNVDDEEEA